LRILITGATGFMGSNLAKKLTEEGHEVTALVRKQSNANFLNKIGVKIIYCDLNDYRSLKNKLKQVDVVYHLAALKRGSFYSKKEYFNVNVKSVENLMNDCPENLQRFVYCSSAGVHGNNFEKSELPVNESYPYKAYSVYEQTQVLAEKTVERVSKKRNMPCTIIRPGFTYGPGNISMIKMFGLIKRHHFFIFAGKGNNLIHPTYIDDFINALILIIKNKKAVNEKFLIAGKEITTSNQLVSCIAKSLNVDLRKVNFSTSLLKFGGSAADFLGRNLGTDFPITKIVDFLVKSRTYDCSKAEKMLGYKAKVGIKRGVNKTVDWYEQQGYL